MDHFIAPGLPYNIVRGFIRKVHLDDIKIESIIESVENFTCIPYTLMNSKCSKRPVVEARQIAMVLIRKNTSKTLKAIGAKFNGRDHSTVLYAVDCISSLCYTNKRFKKLYSDISEDIESKL